MLRREFAHAVGYLNQILPEDMKLKFIHWDFHKFAKRLAKLSLISTIVWSFTRANFSSFLPFNSKSANVLAVLGAVASEALDLIGFYFSGKPVNVKKRATQLSLTSKGRYKVTD